MTPMNSAQTDLEGTGRREPAGGASNLFVDTTVAVDLAIGDSGTQRRVEHMIASRSPTSSSYVQMEYERTVIEAADVVLQLVATAPDETEVLSFVHYRLAQHRHPNGSVLSDRQVRRCMMLVAALYGRFRQVPVARGAVAALMMVLRRHLQQRVRHLFATNATDCDLVRPERPQGQQRPLRCNAAKAMCQLDRHLTQSQAMLNAIFTSLDQDPETHGSKLAIVLGQVANGTPLSAKGQRRCWPIGDVTIALEALPVGTLLSSNARDYDPICRAIGLPLETYAV
jgi:hypothetical protein